MAKKNSLKTYTVAVTGLNAIDSPGPGVAVIRGLRDCSDFKVRIIGLSYEAMEPGIYMDGIADKTYQIPYPAAGRDALLARLMHIHSREKLDAVIPNFDAELYNFIKLAPVLHKAGIHCLLPSLQQFESCSKINLGTFGAKHGFLVPADKTIFSATEIHTAAKMFGYPLVVKGKYYEATVAYTFEQAEKAFHKLQAKWGTPIIVQQFISGTEINVAALGSGQGQAISIIPMRKLYITDKGKAWAGVTLNDPALIALARKFIKVTQWQGGFELEIMRTVAGEPYIMEVNPRFPAWIYLSVGAGQNQPAALLKLAMGKKIKPYTGYAVGKMFIRYAWDQIVDIEQFQKLSTFGELY
jgi:carbamoyl-phosphate synthase large subunit